MTAKPREIDWDGAEVKNATVVLPLSGAASKAWSERFESVLALLAQGSSRWGQVSVTKRAVKVSELSSGSEDDLRHFLESIVAQVNAELAPRPDEQASQPKNPQAAQDEQMAERLRAFSAPRGFSKHGQRGAQINSGSDRS